MNIELRKTVVTTHRGARDVYVDGERWGLLESFSMGRRGTVYYLFDTTGNPVTVASVADHWAGTPSPKITIASNGISALRADDRPFEIRALERIRAAIEAKDFLSPAALVERAADRETERKQRMAEIDAQQQALFDARAQKALDAITTGGADPLRAILDAMTWAQAR